MTSHTNNIKIILVSHTLFDFPEGKAKCFTLTHSAALVQPGQAAWWQPEVSLVRCLCVPKGCLGLPGEKHTSVVQWKTGRGATAGCSSGQGSRGVLTQQRQTGPQLELSTTCSWDGGPNSCSCLPITANHLILPSTSSIFS